jgi:hypothetical protein
MIVRLINPLFQNETKQWDYLITNNQGETRERFPFTINDGDDATIEATNTFNAVKNIDWTLDELFIDVPDGSI